MTDPSIDQLLEIIEDRYSLIVATSKRARQILANEQYEEQESFMKPVTIAAKEIFEGKVKCVNCK
ncbi:MAG: DNA-directed RNA polymerase subunit omega [Bacillota bacterium]|nr:DNA-directed RNA polymerase subunit omega [Bacillota bacterium]